MAWPDTAKLDLYVGSAIEHASERIVLDALLRGLPRRCAWVTIFANVNLGGRQIDFVVATETLTLLVEAKQFARQVEGAVNGQWTTYAAGGGRRPVDNPYLQALSAKNALRDALRAHYPAVRGYPNACVAIAPRAPAGSRIPPSDYKVAVVDSDALAELLAMTSEFRLARSQWTELATVFGLQRVHAVSAACDPLLLAQEALVDAYTAEVRRTYAPDVHHLKADTYALDGRPLDADGVVERVVRADEDLLILGPSGCGKSLLGKAVAIHCLAHGYVPIVVQAKYFSGKLAESVERETSVLGAPSAAGLIRAAHAAGYRLMLLLDGYNECPANEQSALTRSLAAAVRRYGFQLVVTAQADIARADLLTLRRVAVHPPNRALKAAIAGPDSAARLAFLLDSVTSGLEADLVGRVGATLPEGASRFALFDAYARSKLTRSATDGIRLLAAMAALLTDRLAFSMTIRDLERLASRERVSGKLVREVLASGLLTQRADRVAFVHELIFAAFVAESVARIDPGMLTMVIHALRAPKYRHARTLIVGAYDDDRVVAALLAATEDTDLLRAAAAGECGRFAQAWVSQQCRAVLEKMATEAAAVTFSLQGGVWNEACVCEDSAAAWSQTERALMAPIADGVRAGRLLEPVLEAIAVMDRSLARGFQALKDDARRQNVGLRSGLFADVYVMAAKTGLSQLVRCIAQHIPRSRDDEPAVITAIDWAPARTPGQMYLLLNLMRYAENKAEAVPHILPWLGEPWRFHPYHLQLTLLDFVHFITVPDEAVRGQLIRTLDALLPDVHPLLASIVIEALEHLGALETEVADHLVIVRDELQAVLAGVASPHLDTRACSVYMAQFDHPYSSAYWEGIQALETADRRRLLTMACRGASEAGLFVVPLIQELASYDDPAVAPAIQRWLEAPAVDSFMPQEAIAIFLAAHVAFGKLGVTLPPPTSVATGQSAQALLAVGRLYYWTHRTDRSPDQIHSACTALLTELQAPDQRGAASVLYGVAHATSRTDDTHRLLWQRFPQMAAQVSRNALRRPDEQLGYFRFFDLHDRDNALRFAVGLLGELGDMGDLPLLRSLSDDQAVGVTAVAAIQCIEGRDDGAGM